MKMKCGSQAQPKEEDKEEEEEPPMQISHFDRGREREMNHVASVLIKADYYF